jgi:hypothetical protein
MMENTCWIEFADDAFITMFASLCGPLTPSDELLSSIAARTTVKQLAEVLPVYDRKLSEFKNLSLYSDNTLKESVATRADCIVAKA